MASGMLAAEGRAQTASAAEDRPAAVRVTVRTTVPRIARVRQVAAITISDLPDGRHEIAFNVIVAANCQWTLDVRPRLWVRESRVPTIEVRDASGNWVPLSVDAAPVRVEPEHGPCNADAIPVRLRVPGTTHLEALDLVQFDVRPVEPTGR